MVSGVESKLRKKPQKGLSIPRVFTKENHDPNHGIVFSERDVIIQNTAGKTIYENKNVTFPEDWSKLASKVVTSKYLYKGDGEEYLEKNVANVVDRVVSTIAKQAVKQELVQKSDSSAFRDELFKSIINQGESFNSPVWFNLGLYDAYGVRGGGKESNSHHALVGPDHFSSKIDAYQRPQVSACFIQSIEDCMEDIMNHATREAMLFKFGSGTGSNFSNLRGIGEPLSGGGVASGQISFFKIFDIVAGSVMSGGKTRRAAKMVIQDCDHPDLLRFTHWKASEERKALWMCAQPRWAPTNTQDLESEAYKTIGGQNGNNSVRVTDNFMNAALANGDWSLWFRTKDRHKEEVDIHLSKYQDDRYLPDKRFIKRLTNKRKFVNAGEVLEQICRAAAVTGDPGLQYHDNINKWNTVPNFGIIRASNPCSEFMAPDDSACNLASLNLTKYSTKSSGRLSSGKRKAGSLLDLVSFKQAVRNTIISQETLVDYGSYPSEKIARNSHLLRPLGLGYTNLGALLMENGLAYDSKEGRALASAVTSLMTANAYLTSSEIAEQKGAFAEFDNNKEAMLKVLKMHADFSEKINIPESVKGGAEIAEEANKVWEEVLERGEKFGFRNSQVSLLAPTGTIGFMMDVDCTGVEPMPAIAYAKALAGGGTLDVEVKQCVQKGLETLGYSGGKLEGILNFIRKEETVIGAPGLAKEHYNVFATAFNPDNSIEVGGHLKMMAAVQPFLSGAISKTVNLPRGATIQDVKDTYIEGWKLGLKSISLYIDGSKGAQPINIQTKADKKEMKWGERDRPKNSMYEGGFISRAGWSVDIGNTGVQITLGEYDNRRPSESIAEIFVEFGKAGSPFSGPYGLWSREASRGIQKGPRGESIQEFIKHNLGATGNISGFTGHPYIKSCTSIADFAAKLIKLEYFGDTSVCRGLKDGETLPENVAKELRANVLANQRRVRHAQSRIDYIDTAMRDGKLQEVFPLLLDKGTPGALDISEIYCSACGYETQLSGASCRKCDNCGDAEGCG